MTGSAYDFWVLDLDGTLVDIEPAYIHGILAEVGDRLGVGFTPVEAERLWYGDGDARQRVLAGAAVSPERFWEVFHDVEDGAARAEATFLYDDAAATVPTIDEPIGLVTHCQDYLTGPVLDSLDIADWFDVVLCCTDDTGWKPEPEPVESAMSALGVGYNGHEGVLVGDTEHDVGAAVNAGLFPVHVRRPHRAPQACSHPAQTVRRLTELDV
jgi:phosphoglycolate phosphatase